MGWGRTLLLGDIGNRLDIEDTERDIAQLRKDIAGSERKDTSQDRQIETLFAENAELKLYLAASLRLLTSKGVISVAELHAMVHAVDGEDGKIDGKVPGSTI